MGHPMKGAHPANPHPGAVHSRAALPSLRTGAFGLLPFMALWTPPKDPPALPPAKKDLEGVRNIMVGPSHAGRSSRPGWALQPPAPQQTLAGWHLWGACVHASASFHLLVALELSFDAA